MIAKKQLYLWEFFISQSVINIGLQKMFFFYKDITIMQKKYLNDERIMAIKNKPYFKSKLK